MGYSTVSFASKLILFIEKIDELMKSELKPETKDFYCETVVSIGGKLIDKDVNSLGLEGKSQ